MTRYWSKLRYGAPWRAAGRLLPDVVQRLDVLGVHLRRLAGGDLDRRLTVRADDPVGELEATCNRLTDRIVAARDQLVDQAGRLEASRDDLLRLDKAKDDFLALVSHEVRTPLTCILGGVDYLRTTLGGATPAQRALLDELDLGEVVEVIADSGVRLNEFLDDALRMTAIRSGARRLDLRPLRPSDVVSPALGRAANIAMDRGIRLEDDLSGVESWRLLGDISSLRIVFGKLLDNAVTHNTDGGRVLLREVAELPAEAVGTPAGDADLPRLEDQPGAAAWLEDVAWRTIEVRNTGPVIPAERFGALFSRFEIVGEIENHSRGAGLSLSIARALVEEHGGRLAVRSDDEFGTSFYAQLPAITSDAAAGRGALWDDAPEGVGGRSGHEEVGVVADPAGRQVELHDPGAGPAGLGDESSGGVDGSRGADHEEEITVPHGTF
ncbi:MAG: hypothetical protein GY838_20010 [bacterium]|nr:hypothetical protein [bacterium]